MFSKKFNTKVYENWIFAGDYYNHLGASAVALPHTNFSIELEFIPGKDKKFSVSGHDHSDIDFLIQTGLQILDLDKSCVPYGRLIIKSQNSSRSKEILYSVLCVAIARWFLDELSEVGDEEIVLLACGLDSIVNEGHTELAILTGHHNKPVCYSTNGDFKLINVSTLPNFIFNKIKNLTHHSKIDRSIQEFIKSNPEKANQIREKMNKAVKMALVGLEGYEKEGTLFTSCQALNLSMKLSHECLEELGILAPSFSKRPFENQLKG